MLGPSKMLVALAGVVWLVSIVSCGLTPVPPHARMDLVLDAQRLWRTVTNEHVLPGFPHDLNGAKGVTVRWRDFLRDQGTATLNDASRELDRLVEQWDRRDYKIRKRVWNFLKPTNREKLLVVAEPAEQFVARKLVNAYTERWYPFYEAQREAELAAMQREEREASDVESKRRMYHEDGPPSPSSSSSQSSGAPGEDVGRF